MHISILAFMTHDLTFNSCVIKGVSFYRHFNSLHLQIEQLGI